MPVQGSYWQRDASWDDRWHDAVIPGSVDVAVIGGGFAGLTTAIRLRERMPGATIALLEAERVGYGASGRNAGFLSPLAAPIWLLGAERSSEQAWAAARINAEMHAVARWIGEHVPDAELTRASLALTATSQLADAALGEFTRAIEHVGLPHRLQGSRVHPEHLTLEMDAYTVHPYKLVRGLAELAVRSGVVIRERARVHAVEPAGLGAHVHLAGGVKVLARRVVVCTNAYTSSIALGERVPALSVHSFMTATPPLAASATDGLVRDGDFTVEVNAAQGYHRMHRDRIVYGAIDTAFAPKGDDFAVPDGVRSRLARQMKASFPGVANLEIADAWSGKFHATANGLPIIRTSEVNPLLVYNVGYGGTGVALALACARLAAGVATSGLVPCSEDARLLAVIHATRISMRDSVRTVARLAQRIATPWSLA
jgi:glycine/D-amino acid oxidase-like deaminating enzyme